ncbi:MAG: ABC transporter permease [Vicinamibacterales bacterium]
MLAVIGRIDLNRSLRTARGAALANLTVARVAVDPPIAYGRPRDGRAYLDTVEQKVVAVAGAENVAWLSLLPGSRSVGGEYRVEPPAPYTRQLDLDLRILDPDALPDSIIPAGGRVFYSTDRPGGCLVAILNQTAAERDFAGAPLGRTLQAADGREVAIVGIVDDRTSETDVPAPAVYLYSRQVPALTAIRTPFYSKAADIVAAESPTSGMLATVAVSPTYFDILQDPAIEGRAFDEGDDGGACGVAVISEAGAQMAFGGNAIGGALIGGGGRAEIVGVTRAFALGIAQRPDVPWVFRPFAQTYQPRSALVVRGHDLERRLDEAIATVPNGSELEPASSMQAFLLRTALAPERIASALVTVCALLALALSVAGLQGAMTDHVARRKRELAVRLAMGARPPHLAAGILGHGVRLVLGGTVVGLAASAVMLPVLGLNPGLDTLSGATTVAASVGAALAALAGLVAMACALPVWRAIAVDPRTVLQSE